ncbi:plasmid partitioning protein RepB C-terminal domain-containing protein, partial [Burkholderia vietnamiensis]|uniref:plasmid partitioning protein RepB C-terminal domain-containing protein n=1 Tax=Burkholderia vietnamiensis TaxID=60552 RepID=UPI00299E31BA
MSWSPNSTRTDKEIYNRHCATPKPAESVTFPKSAVTFAEIRTTPASRLIEGKKPKKLAGVSPEQMAKMEREMSNLQGQYKVVEETYGQDVLNLVLAKGYLARLLENESVRMYLQQNQADLVSELEAIVDTVTLDQNRLEPADQGVE